VDELKPDLPFVCRHEDPRCEDDPCPAGIQWLCNAPADHPARKAPALTKDAPDHG
jgi:hypothetical protein